MRGFANEIEKLFYDSDIADGEYQITKAFFIARPSVIHVSCNR